MDQLSIEIRKARPTEARFIARNVMAALGAEVFSESLGADLFNTIEVLAETCGMPDTLYSYRNTIVATVDDMPVASLTAYDGALYKELKAKTFGYVSEKLGVQFPEMDDETCPGEYYIDSVCVLPSFRGHHILGMLLSQALETAEGLGFTDATLIAKQGDKRILNLYARNGFKQDGILHCFGRDYVRMVCPIS